MKKLYDLQKQTQVTMLLETMTIPYSISLKELTTFISVYLEVCIYQYKTVVRNSTLSIDMSLNYLPNLCS